MTTAALQAASFYREIAEHGSVWTIRDLAGFPQPLRSDGTRVQPFWSLRSRATRVVARVPAYAGFEVIELAWDVFETRWVPGLARDRVLVGLNWAGPRATGYDVLPEEVIAAVATARKTRVTSQAAPPFLKSFELDAVRLMVGDGLPQNLLVAVLAAAEGRFEYTGHGYFVTVTHPLLPTQRRVFDRPLLCGRTDYAECGFVVFVQDSELTLECHPWSDPIPEHFRDDVVWLDHIGSD
jgi:hypothetical protein